MLEMVTRKLGDLSKQFVYVGGCATGLLVTDSARPPVRATQDVDVIAEVTSLTAYYAIERQLEKLGFKRDMSQDAPLCRWTIGPCKVDVMSTDQKVLGFTSRWYEEAIKSALQIELPSGQNIRLIAPPLFVATKIEAFHGRGNGDYLLSHDIEDIITVVDGRVELPTEIARLENAVTDYIADEIEGLLSDGRFSDSIPAHLPPDEANQARVAMIIERLRKLARL
jgi:predicted nucleotidyltransferase